MARRKSPTAADPVSVMSVAMLSALHAAFDRAENERAAVVLTGRNKIFSAGFDLNVFAKGDAREIYDMMSPGTELAPLRYHGMLADRGSHQSSTARQRR
jgi:enoyl-CoA hydratase/carnithine racemase